jgi:hypothetical protein
MRYTIMTTGVPARALGALLPHPMISPGASSNGPTEVHGYPGTMPIPASKPAALPPTCAGTRQNQGSYCSPDVWMPGIYYTTPRGMHPPVSLFRDNPMPVPARSILNMPRLSMRMRRVGGQNQIGQPAVVQVWPQWRGRQGGS